MLRHMLGVFFPLYASHGSAKQQCVGLSVLPTLRAIADAPSRSPLADVDVDDVACFLVSITVPGKNDGQAVKVRITWCSYGKWYSEIC